MHRMLVNKSISMRIGMTTERLRNSRSIFQVTGAGGPVDQDYRSFEENSKFKEKIKADFSASGLKNVFISEIGYFGKLATDGEDLEFMRKAVGSAATDEVISTFKGDLTHRVFLHFIQACHRLNNVDEAMKAWGDPTLKEKYYPIQDTPEIYKACVIYMDLLLNNGMYDELLDFFNEDYEAMIKQARPTLLALLACYKKGTYEALLMSIKILNGHFQTLKGSGINPGRYGEKMILSSAALAYNIQEYALANLILESTARGDTFLIQSLHIMVLAKSGRLEKAIEKMNENFMPRAGETKRRVLYILVESLVSSASAEKDGGKKLNEVMDMVSFIEQHAELVTENIDDILFSALDFDKKEAGKRKEKSERATVSSQELA